jgi:hypothetical protein
MNRSSVLLVGAGALVVGGAIFLAQTSYTGDNLNILIDRFYHKSGIFNPRYGMNITISNPTMNSISLTRPEIKNIYKGKQVGSSIPSAEVFYIKSKSSVEIKDLEIQIDGKEAVKVLPDFVNYIIKKIQGAKASIPLDTVILVNVNGISQTLLKQVSI